MFRATFRIAAPIAATIAIATALTPSPATAQDPPEHVFPEGWEVRFDQEGSSMDDLHMVAMPPGLHITTGPRLIAYHPDSVASGDFRIESATYLFDPEGRCQAFGFFIGGEDLQGPDQRYVNGEQVWSGPRADLATDGVFGLRVNHRLDLHVTTIASGTLN